MPLDLTPTYCATKAPLHSYSQSLRYQLRDTAIEVLELIKFPRPQTHHLQVGVKAGADFRRNS